MEEDNSQPQTTGRQSLGDFLQVLAGGALVSFCCIGNFFETLATKMGIHNGMDST